MIHRVEIAFLFISLERLRLERQQILLDLEQLTSDMSFTLEKPFFKASGTSFSGREVALLATKSL